VKILHTVTDYFPTVGGLQEVVQKVSDLLVRFGHEVTVATAAHPDRPDGERIQGVEVRSFAVDGNWVRGLTGETAAYQAFLRNARFDVVANFNGQCWPSDLAFPILDEIRGVKVFIPTGFSGLGMPAYDDYFSRMPGWLKQYDMNVFLSDEYQDIQFARRAGINNTVLIPNGASEEEFGAAPRADIRALLGVPADHLLVLHVGSHTSLKGHKEAIRIFSLARLRRATLLLVGNGMAGGCAERCRRAERRFMRSPLRWLDQKQLLIREFSREETVAAFHAADLFLFPSRVECSPIVLYECMASRTPFLSTDVGNAREIVRWSGGGEILSTKPRRQGFFKARVWPASAALTRLANDPARRQAMAHSGFAAWKRRFTWEKIARDYEALYLRLLRDKTPLKISA
jgi:glycosyltransferase involved in cell wall biosynthesis